MATEKRVTLLEVDIDNSAVIKKQGDLIKQIEVLKKSQKSLKKETDNLTDATEEQTKEYVKNEAEIKNLQGESRKYSKVLQDQSKAQESNRKIISSTDGSINSLRNALNVNKTTYKSLTAEQRKNDQIGGKLLATINAQDEEYKELSRSIGNTQVDVGNYGRALEGVGSKIKGLLTAGAVFGLIKGLFNVNKELREADRITRTLFDGTADEIRALTVEARGLSKAYDLEVNQTLKTANVLSKQFGVDGVEALSLIEQGVRKGADANGEFLENLSEYSTQFRLAGLSAEESISIITQQVKEGVFSDKGVDAIKEATLSIREMTPNAVKALEAIGLSSDQIQKDISSGAKTSFDVIQEVSKRTAEFGENSVEAGLILADVFKGAGEDAGDFIFKLGDLNTTLSEQKDVISESDQAQINLTKSFNAFVTNVANGDNTIGKVFSSLLNFTSEILDGLTSIGVSFDELQEKSFLGSLSNESKAAVNEFKSFIKNLGDEETRSRKELSQVLLKEDKDRLAQLASLNDDESIKTKRRLEERIKAVEEFANREINVATEKAKEIRRSNTSRQQEELEVFRQNSEELINGIKSNAQLEVEIREQTEQQKRNSVIDSNEFFNKLRTETFALEIQRLQDEGATVLEIQLAQLRLEREQAVQAAKETGDDLNKVSENFAQKEIQIRQAVEIAKTQAIGQALGQAKGLFDENTAAYKALAITEASIATYLAANKALADLPTPANFIAAGVTIATGLINVSKIAGFAEGTESAGSYAVNDLSSHTGIITGTPNISRSNGDNMLATVKTGEAILNEKQQSKINGWLGFNGINRAVNGYADGTTFASPSVTNTINRNVINNSTISNGEVNTGVELVVDVKDIVRETTSLDTKVQDATI